jgi:hypothetical protein
MALRALRALTSPIALRSLVPPTEASALVPAGFSLIVNDLSAGLPTVLELSPRLSLALVLNSGSIRTWADADPAAVISADYAEPAGGLADAGRSPVRLLLLDNRRPIAGIPLVRGHLRLLPDDGVTPVRVGVTALSWRVTAGCAMGPGAQGCWLRLAWRPIGGGQ